MLAAEWLSVTVYHFHQLCLQTLLFLPASAVPSAPTGCCPHWICEPILQTVLPENQNNMKINTVETYSHTQQHCDRINQKLEMKHNTRKLLDICDNGGSSKCSQPDNNCYMIDT